MHKILILLILSFFSYSNYANNTVSFNCKGISQFELIGSSGKKEEMVEKISQGKINKFISDNTLLNQPWIMDPKLKVSDIIKGIKVLDFIRYKVGEGV